MAIKVFSCFVEGLDAHKIEVEVDILQGLPGLSIVGLGDTAVQEAKERIRSAIKNSGATYPQQKKIINLAPAHLRKNGACFDLSMAAGLLQASGQLQVPEDAIIVGELALDGQVRPVAGALSAAMFAQKHQLKFFVPIANIEETKLLQYEHIYPVKSLRQFIEHCQGTQKILAIPVQNIPEFQVIRHATPEVDMNMVQGQLQAKRALEISAAGGHHLLLYGPPGTGKTLLARALQGILPPLTVQEKLEVLQIYSAAGKTFGDKETHTEVFQRPFRIVHQSCSLPALVGGGANAHPGEISLAHHGILFFDEIAEAPRYLLESLRQPLEQRTITVSRVHHHVTYPANFTLIAAMNPCPCGYYGAAEKHCTCSNNAIVQYHKKLSGPILDRFDLFLQLYREPVKLNTAAEGESSQEFLKNITTAREKQLKRFSKLFHRDKKSKIEIINIPHLNSQMKPMDIRQFCIMDAQTEKVVIEYANKAKISTRSFHNILKISRTIADLNGNSQITVNDALEAFNYRAQPTSPLV